MAVKMAPRKLLIAGAGEFAQIACEYFTHDSDFDVVGFAVDADYLPDERTLGGLPVIDLADASALFPSEDHMAFAAIPASGLNQHRAAMVARLDGLGYELATYVSSRAFVWRNAIVGRNCFIFENNVVQPFVTIGDNCVLWSGNHIGHRTVVADNVFIASHVVVSGYCTVGEFAFLGVNATIVDRVTIGERCIIGAGALVVRDAKPDLVYVGSPAKPMPGLRSDAIQL